MLTLSFTKPASLLFLNGFGILYPYFFSKTSSRSAKDIMYLSDLFDSLPFVPVFLGSVALDAVALDLMAVVGSVCRVGVARVDFGVDFGVGLGDLGVRNCL